MSLHLYHESRMTPSSKINSISTIGHESDSDNNSPSAVIRNLEKELKKERDESSNAKKEVRVLSSLLQQAQDDSALLDQKYENAIVALHKATNKVNELDALRDKMEGEIAELKASLEAASDREGRLNNRLEFSNKECSQFYCEKSLLLDKVTELEQEVKKLEENAQNDQELLAELEILRTTNLDLRRDLVAAREKGLVDDEDSPNRMVFDQFDHTTDGMNLHQELIMLGSPLTATFSQSVQFPSCEDIREEHEGADQWRLLMHHASVQTDCAPPKLFSVASTQTATRNLEHSSSTALQPYHVPYLTHGNPSANFPQPIYPSSEPKHGGLSTKRVFWLVWVLAMLALVFAIMNNGGRIDVTPIVDSCRNGLTFRNRKGIPPH